MQRLIDVYGDGIEQSVGDNAIDERRRRLHAYLQATKGHFEYPL